MAEIDIEKKNKDNKNKRNKTGLYIIIAILVLGFIFWWFAALDDEEDVEVIRPTVMEQIIPENPGQDQINILKT